MQAGEGREQNGPLAGAEPGSSRGAGGGRLGAQFGTRWLAWVGAGYPVYRFSLPRNSGGRVCLPLQKLCRLDVGAAAGPLVCKARPALRDAGHEGVGPAPRQPQQPHFVAQLAAAGDDACGGAARTHGRPVTAGTQQSHPPTHPPPPLTTQA